MAVAVKHSSETATGNPFDRMPIVSLVGMVYVLASLAIVFKLLPVLWGWACGIVGLSADSIGSLTVLTLVMFAAAGGLVVLGGLLLGPKPMPGVKAGIFVALVGFLLVLFLTRWFSLWVEHFVYDLGWFGQSGPTIGLVLVAVFFGSLLLLAARWFSRPGFEKSLVSFENQGWFSATAYKKFQGMKVRRGTILGILLLVGAGIYTMISHKTLERGPDNWELNIPFTGMVTITRNTEGDAAPELNKLFPEGSDKLVISRYALRDINDKVDPDKYVKIDNVTKVPTRPEWKDDGTIVPKKEYEEEIKKGERVPDVVPPVQAWGPTTFSTIPILPAVRFTLPLLLLGLALWFAYRVVNLPVFADFLIATEAELNKVSWTTRRRLFQDTIVVLVTVALLSFYLFAMDQLWSHLLSWKHIGVIVINKTEAKGTDQKPW